MEWSPTSWRSKPAAQQVGYACIHTQHEVIVYWKGPLGSPDGTAFQRPIEKRSGVFRQLQPVVEFAYSAGEPRLPHD